MTLLKSVVIAISICYCAMLQANNSKEMSAAQLVQQVQKLNQLQNQILKKGSTLKDAQALFNFYTDDFVYVHEQYGGEYSKQHLYDNTIKYLQSGHYARTSDRYQIVNIIWGRNSIAVNRLQTSESADVPDEYHLSVIEFDGLKVKRIVEYW